MERQGFQPLTRKHQSEGIPSTTPLRRGVEKKRSFSDTFYVTKTYRLGSLADLKYEELSSSVPLSASFRLAAAPKASSSSATANESAAAPTQKERRRLVIELQARRSRATVSMDSGFALVLAVIAVASFIGQASAYTMPATPRAFRQSSAPAAPIPAALDPATATATSKLKRATRYLGTGSSSRVVEEAVAFAVEAHSGQKRKSGEAYVVHPIETACILAEMKVDVDTVVAGLLHDVVEDTEWSTDELCSRFGEAVGSIVDGVTDVDTELSKAEHDAYNQQRLLLAMGGNLNVVLVKLADRVHNMRTLGAMPAEKRAKKAKETMELFVPLAKTVGVKPLEAELRALSAQHLSPLAELTAAAEHGAAREGNFGKLMGFADQAFATAKCPALLSEFLLADEALRKADLSSKLASHRETWAAHCSAADVPHLASGTVAGSRASHRQQPPGWLSNVRFPGSAQKDAATHLRAAYAAALVAGFTNTPAAFGSESLEAVQSLTALFAQ